MSERLGEILVEQQLLSPQHLDQALDHQKTHGGRLGKALLGLGFIDEDDLMRALAQQYAVPGINLSRFPAPSEAVHLIPVETATKYEVLPLSRVGTSLTLAMVDPANVFAMDQIKFMTGFNVEPVVVSETAMSEAINRYFTNVEEVERQREIEDLVSFIDEGQAESVELEATEEEALDLQMLEKEAAEAPRSEEVERQREIEDLVSFIDEGQAESVELEATEEEALDLQMLEKEAAEAPVIRLVNYILADAVKRGA